MRLVSATDSCSISGTEWDENEQTDDESDNETDNNRFLFHSFSHSGCCTRGLSRHRLSTDLTELHVFRKFGTATRTKSREHSYILNMGSYRLGFVIANGTRGRECVVQDFNGFADLILYRSLVDQYVCARLPEHQMKLRGWSKNLFMSSRGTN